MSKNIKILSNRIFKPVHESKKRYVLLKGSAGSGKSVDIAQQYIIRLMRDPGRNLLCIRKSEVTNRNSTFAELSSVISKYGLEPYWKFSFNPLSLTCINGASVIFRGMNDERQREKLKSISFRRGKLTDVWLEEMTELSQSDFEIIDDRLRGQLPDNLFYQIKGAFNPVSSRHWIKSAFFDCPDENTLLHHSVYLDNRFIDPAFVQRMERRKIVDPEGYRIYGLGDWGESQGLVFQNWSAENISLSLEDYDCVSMGQDFGFNHPNVILLLGMKDGDIFVLRELYLQGLDTREIIERARDLNFPKNISMYCDSAEPDRIKTWRAAGFRALPVRKEKNSVNSGISWLKDRRIFVSPACQNLISELSLWKWKKDPISGKFTDEVTPFDDDAISALRYGAEPWRKGKLKVKTLKGL